MYQEVDASTKTKASLGSPGQQNSGETGLDHVDVIEIKNKLKNDVG